MARQNKLTGTKLLLKLGADPNIADSYGTTPLIRLASCGYTGMMKTLIRAGADISAENIFRHTALSKLKEQHPDKYNRFIQNTVVKSRQQTLKRDGAAGAFPTSTYRK